MLIPTLTHQMASAILDEIVDRFCSRSLSELDDQGIMECIKTEIVEESGVRGLMECVEEVWEEAKERVCFGKAWFWEKHCKVTKLDTEAIVEQEKESILKIVKELCLA